MKVIVFQSGMAYGDLFADTWKAFTDHPVRRLSDYDGKRVRYLSAYHE